MTIEVEEPKTETKILVHVFEKEINAIREDANRRAEHLKLIASLGLSTDEIRTATSSLFAVEQHIENELLKTNVEYARLRRAGINPSINLPDNLKTLKQLLLDWEKTTNKYLYLDDSFNVDEEALENAFVKLGHKIYVTEAGVNAIEEMKPIQELFEKYRVPPHQVLSISFLNERLTCDDQAACNQLPRSKYMVARRFIRNFIAKDLL